MRFLVILLIGLSSCKVLNSQNTKKISFAFMVHKPYCGGARPTAELGKGYDEPLANKKYIVYKGDSVNAQSKKVGILQLNGDGIGTLTLQPGKYILMDEEKSLPLKEFIALKTSLFKENYEISSTACFEEWQHEPDLLIEILPETTKIEHVFSSNCWTGMTNCVRYTGPPAP